MVHSRTDVPSARGFDDRAVVEIGQHIGRIPAEPLDIDFADGQAHDVAAVFVFGLHKIPRSICFARFGRSLNNKR